MPNHVECFYSIHFTDEDDKKSEVMGRPSGGKNLDYGFDPRNPVHEIKARIYGSSYIAAMQF